MKKFNFHTHSASTEKKKDETTSSANISQQILFICQLIIIFTNIARAEIASSEEGEVLLERERKRERKGQKMNETRL
jgi:hypothetical protein